MEKKKAYNIPNRNGIDATLYHAQTFIEGSAGERPGDDELMLVIPDFEQYETDLCQAGDITLSFSKSQAQRLARQLLRLSRDLMTAEERADMGDTPIIAVPSELLKQAGI